MTKYKDSYEESRLIGVAGMQSGGGSTHLCMMIANYLVNVKGHSTAIIDLSGTKDYGQAQIILNARGDVSKFNYGGIDFFSQADKGLIYRLARGTYEYTILDLGQNKEAYDLLPGCFLRIATGKMNQWNTDQYISGVNNIKLAADKQKIHYFSFSSNAKSRKLFKKIFGEESGYIPFEPDPFSLHGDSLDFLNKLFD